MDIKKILFAVIILCVIISGIMVIGAMTDDDEEKEEVTNITNNSNQPAGVNNAGNNSSSATTGGGGGGGSFNAIDAGGTALVDEGLVSSDEKLFDESKMRREADTFIQILKNAYGADKKLAEDAEATYEYLAPYFDINKSELKSLAKTLAMESNKQNTNLVMKDSVHAVKQLSDTEFAVYFHLKGSYYNEQDTMIDSLESPYHIMRLTKTKKGFVISYLSISSDSYVKQ